MGVKILSKRRALNRSWGGDLFINLLLLLFGVVMVLPMVYAICSALKPLDEFFVFPPRFFVRNPTLQNFSDLFRIFASSRVPLARYIFNTLFIAVLGTIGQVIIASLCAYAIAKLRFPGKNVMFKIVVTALMFNTTVTSITSFLVMNTLGLIDNWLSILLPTFCSALGLYLMKQFMEQMVPDTLLEAARIDGSGELRTFFCIVMPMVKPAWLTLVVFAFQGLWNTAATPYIYSEELKTINYALSQLMTTAAAAGSANAGAASGTIARSGAMAAGTVQTMLVPIIMFVITQSSIVETMATSGMKD